VTVITLSRGRNVVTGFTLGYHIIMAAGASAQHLEVIHRDRRFPHAGAVAVFAHVRGIDVVRPLAGGDGAIVAA